MKFYSTQDKNYRVGFEEAVRQGLAPNGGLFMPETIDALSSRFWKGISSKKFSQIAFEVADHFLKGSLPGEELMRLIDHTISFEAPLAEVEEIFSPWNCFMDQHWPLKILVLGFWQDCLVISQNMVATLLFW